MPTFPIIGVLCECVGCGAYLSTAQEGSRCAACRKANCEYEGYCVRDLDQADFVLHNAPEAQ